MATDAEQLVWYAAYGSNTYSERFTAYLAGSLADGRYGAHAAAVDPRPPRDSRRSTMAYPMYFAGHSVRWSSPVAFVGLSAVDGGAFPCRLYLVSVEQLRHVVGAENGVESVPSFAPDDVAVGEWAAVPMPADGDPSRAKYNALLRLPDVDGHPVLTVTTCRTLNRGQPSVAYLTTIRRGLASLGLSHHEVDGVVESALARSLVEAAR